MNGPAELNPEPGIGYWAYRGHLPRLIPTPNPDEPRPPQAVPEITYSGSHREIETRKNRISPFRGLEFPLSVNEV